MHFSVVQTYFVVFGLALLGVGVAVLIDFRGLGKRWEEGVNQNSASVNKVARMPWPPNPYLGPVLRPAAGIFAIVLGTVSVLSVLAGGIR